MLGVDSGAVVDDNRGVGVLPAHWVKTSDVLRINQRTHRDSVACSGFPHGLHGIGLEPVCIAVGLDAVATDAEIAIGSHSLENLAQRRIQCTHHGKDSRMFGNGVCVIVVVVAVVEAMRDEDVPRDVLGEAELDEVVIREATRLQVLCGLAGCERETFYIGCPDVAVGIDVASLKILGSNAAGQCGSSKGDGMSSVDFHDIRE